MPVPADDCVPDIALSIQSEFRTGVKLSSLIAPASRVDTGPAVISRKAARLCGRTASQLKAILVDRFFETKREAIAWTNAHPHFMTLQIVRSGSPGEPSEL
jgi:hypothetical protein